MTLGKPVIMGRRTFLSLGRVLDQRVNIVLSRDAGFVADGAVMADSLEAGLEHARRAAKAAGVDEIMVIGGDDVFREVMPRAGRIYLTEVHASPEADTWLLDFDLSELARGLPGRPRTGAEGRVIPSASSCWSAGLTLTWPALAIRSGPAHCASLAHLAYNPPN